MIRLLLAVFITALLSIDVLQAQQIIPDLQNEDGTSVASDHVYLEEDQCAFHTIGHLSMDWEFYLYDTTGSYTLCLSKKQEETFSIDYDDIDWDIAKKVVIKGDSSIYYKGMIYMTQGLKKLDSIPVTFNLSVSIPRFLSALFTYDGYNWDYDDFLGQNSKFYITLSAARVTSITLKTGWSNLFSFPDGFYFRFGEYFLSDRIIHSDNTVQFYTDQYPEWGQYYGIRVENKYGDIWLSEVLCTTDYIADPNIIARIDSLKRLYTSVETVELGNAETLVQESETVRLVGSTSEIATQCLFSIDGHLIKTQCGGDAMFVGDVPKGLYLIRYKTTMERVLTFKFLKL